MFASNRLLRACTVAMLTIFLLGACQSSAPARIPAATLPDPTQVATAESNLSNLIPAAASVKPSGGIFTLTNSSQIFVEPGNNEVQAIGEYLSDRLRPATGFALPVEPASGTPVPGSLTLTTADADPTLGQEGYDLTITPESVTLSADQGAGLFYGVQTLRQLLPPKVESTTVQPGPWDLATGVIRDIPRFVWRGMMLDVARHFFGVEDVKKLIDAMAYYKLNRLHLHLSDDQGWRIEIKSWPNLTKIGGSTEVGGGPGGFYTQADYAAIVAYAQSRYITVVPEIDMPGHINAALASYPELDCSGTPPSLYTGTDVGFSSLCLTNATDFQFAYDVIAELSSITPGPYIHIGGDEAASTPLGEYIDFVQRLEGAARSHGKQVIGWEEIGQAKLLTTTIAQHWNNNFALQAAAQGAQIIMSPADRAYLDMKYDARTPLGQNWAGYINIQHAYLWDPASILPGLSENQILGVEAPLWSETLLTLQDVETMAFPRLIGIAEIGWSPQAGRDWDNYLTRLAAHGPRLTLMNIFFYKSPEVPWK